MYNYLPQDDISRVEKLEFLDERELVKQLFEHYCLTFAWINGSHTQKRENDVKYISDNKTSTEPLNFDDLEMW